MKIKRFTPGNTKGKAHGIASVRVSKSGAITFSKTVKIELDLKSGDKIEFIQSEESPKDWFITKSDNGFKLRTPPTFQVIMLNSSCVANEIFKSVEFKGRSARFLIATKPTIIDGITCYAIITSNIKTLKE
jgi:bifunctional DNA-binding transcriptional regulator/antitoxin component of YhaV-PrlF toxin-antitoxin module